MIQLTLEPFLAMENIQISKILSSNLIYFKEIIQILCTNGYMVWQLVILFGHFLAIQRP